MRCVLGIATALWVSLFGLAACGSGGAGEQGTDAGSVGDAGGGTPDATIDSLTPLRDGGSPDGATAGDSGPPAPACTGGVGGDGGAAGSCYAITCSTGAHTLQENRDRLIRDYAKRRCTDSCSLWAALNQAERYIFLMDTAYLADPTSRLYPPSYNNTETALDHAVALYTINGPKAGQGTDGSGRGGNDYNRIYLGFDALGECVMRNFAQANPAKTAGYNQWQKSDDLAGPHAPFTQREMIYWYKALTDLQSNGPQFHHWHADSDFTQTGLNARLGVCGVTDRSLTELTIAFDFYHNSDPLGDYAGRGGFGWQIVDQHDTVPSNWAYTPTSCPMTAPVNTDPYGGGTFAGMGPSLVGGACVAAPLGDGGC